MAQIGGNQIFFPEIDIDLRPSSGSNLSTYYEAGNICARFYHVNNLPSDEVLKANLFEILRLYRYLSNNENIPKGPQDKEEDEGEDLQTEDLSLIRNHKRWDRNRKLANRAKKIHGMNCKICGFNFEKKYGDIGKDYIEAHHLQPLHELKGEKVLLSPKDDFTVLCSNCHRNDT